jgi:hypothetical protein
MTSHENILKFLTTLLNFLISIISLETTIRNKKNSPKKEEFQQREKEVDI